MAERRMFSKSIIDSDLFLDMPATTQMLYFHLAMRADDDGFINNPKRIMRMIGASDDDMRILIAKQFVILFDSGIVVIKHWRIHNYIRSDRYKPSIFVEKNSLHLDKGMVYQENSNYNHSGIPNDNQPGTNGIPDVNQTGDNMDTQVRLDKDSIDKNSIYIKDMYPETEVSEPPTPKKKTKTTRFIPPTVEEVRRYCQENNYSVDAERFVDFYECKGWMVGKNKMKNWKAAVRTWVRQNGKGAAGNGNDYAGPSASVKLW